MTGSKNAVQCRLPQPVISFLFLPMTLSLTSSTIPRDSCLSGVVSSFFSSVDRMPRRLQPSRKTVTPLHPDSQAFM